MNISERFTAYEKAVLNCEAARKAEPYDLTAHVEATREMAIARNWFSERIAQLEGSKKTLRIALARKEMTREERRADRAAGWRAR